MTFIINGDFILNARLLDDQRLGKQRVEARQIINAICNGGNWENHPIVKAWKPFVEALKYYTNCIILEWVNRGKENNLPLFNVSHLILMPWWATWDRLHQSHRAMLLRKNPFFYKDKFNVDPEYMLYGYIWPDNLSYDDRFAPLNTITSPIPKELIDPVYCQGKLKSGINNGKICGRLVKDKQPYCTIHRKTFN